jgi:pentapeptide MXKDX repeat protein
MKKLLAGLCACVFALGAGIATAQPAQTDIRSTAGMMSKDTMAKDTMAKHKYVDCMKKDASGKAVMDKDCKDKMDKSGSMSNGADAMPKGGDAMSKGTEKGAMPTGAMPGKDAPKGK